MRQRMIIWHHKDGTSEASDRLELPCPLCDVDALAFLPDALLAVQPDDTSVVCVPALGGCNHGFAMDSTRKRGGDGDENHGSG